MSKNQTQEQIPAENKAAIDSNDENLHEALIEGNLDFAELLIASKANVNAKNSRGNTSLYTAIAASNLKQVKWLLSHKADVSAPPASPISHLQWAKIFKRTRIVNFLQRYIEGGGVDLADDVKAVSNLQIGENSLHAAIEEGCLETVQLLVEEKADVNTKDRYQYQSALHAGLKIIRLDIVKYLLEKKADANTKIYDLSPLTMVMVFNDGPLFDATEQHRLKLVQALVEHKADVNEEYSGNPGPLWLALHRGYLTIARFLIESQANVNAKDRDGNTPLHEAIKYGLDITRHLIEHKADINVKNNRNEAIPLPSLCGVAGLEDTVRYLVENKVDLNTNYSPPGNLLSKIVIIGDKEMATFLLEHKANVDAKDVNGTAVQSAARIGSLSMVQQLAEYKADLTVQDSQGFTLLHLAYRHPELREWLIEHKADLSAKSLHYGNPMSYARSFASVSSDGVDFLSDYTEVDNKAAENRVADQVEIATDIRAVNNLALSLVSIPAYLNGLLLNVLINIVVSYVDWEVQSSRIMVIDQALGVLASTLDPLSEPALNDTAHQIIGFIRSDRTREKCRESWKQLKLEKARNPDRLSITLPATPSANPYTFWTAFPQVRSLLESKTDVSATQESSKSVLQKAEKSEHLDSLNYFLTNAR